MWTIPIVILALQLCGELSAYSLYPGYKVNDMSGAYEQQAVPVNQHAVYTSEYGAALHDLAAYRQKLEQQGLFSNPPLIHANNANDYGYQYLSAYPQPQQYYQQQQTKAEPCEPEEKGDYHTKHKFIPNTSVDSEKHEQASEVTPLSQLNATIQTIGGSIGERMNAIRAFVQDIGQRADGQRARMIAAIRRKLDRMESQLESDLRQIIIILDAEDTNQEQWRNFFSDDDDDESRSLIEPNVVDSSEGLKLKALDDNLRTDFKQSIADAIKRAQDKLNQLIEQQISKVNGKIGQINEKVEAVVGKLANLRPQPAAADDDYTTIHWEPKTIATTTATPAPHSTSTPDYFKYTVPGDFYQHNEHQRKDDDENEYRSGASAVQSAPITEDLQAQVLERVKEKLLENPIDDELKSDDAHSESIDVEKAAGEELRSELQMSSDDKSLNDNRPVEIEKSTESESRKVVNEPETIEAHEDNEDNDDDEDDEEEARALDKKEPLAGIEEDTSVVRPTQAFHFDELEVIQLIPVIIEQLRQGHVTENEQSSLKRIFGEALWSLIAEEAKRNPESDGEMNPLLRTIVNSEEVRLAKRDIQAQIGNDIYKNSLRRVYRGKVPSHGLKRRNNPYIALDDDRKLLSPSERLLNMIAAIVHKSNVMEKERVDAETRLREKRKFARRAKSKKAKANLDSNLRDRKIPLGIAMPRQRYVDRILSTNRMKRSIIKFGTDLADMKALLDQVNRENDSEQEEEEVVAGEKQQQQQLSDDDDFDDYMNDDEYMDDDEYDYSQPKKQLTAESGKEDNNDDEEEDDDNDYGSNGINGGWYHRRNIYDDYEDGSVNEFINLARQRDRREKSFTPQLADNDDYDEDDEVYDDEN